MRDDVLSEATCKLVVRAEEDEALAAKLRAALREAQVVFREVEPGRFEARGTPQAMDQLFRQAGLWLGTAELERCQASMLIDGEPAASEPGGLPRLREVLARWWATGLADWLQSSRLRYRFQPVVQLGCPENLLGFEALLALRSGEGGLPPVPDRLIDAASRACLLRELDEASIEAALREASRLPSESLLFLNCMPETILAGGLAEQLASSSREHRRDPASNVLEINLSQAVRLDAVALTRALRALRAAGPRIALDRLDAEPWALDLVGVLQPDYLKIDRSLIHQVHSDPNRQARLEPMLRACQQAGATPIAVGIEEGAEGSWLEGRGIAWGQGFLFGLPEEPA
jgi:EAL domain-containing protein (putative c-di-GMP-specific phosphodiesterase class I)